MCVSVSDRNNGHVCGPCDSRLMTYVCDQCLIYLVAWLLVNIPVLGGL
jgi:hypothetical protein